MKKTIFLVLVALLLIGIQAFTTKEAHKALDEQNVKNNINNAFNQLGKEFQQDFSFLTSELNVTNDTGIFSTKSRYDFGVFFIDASTTHVLGYVSQKGELVGKKDDFVAELKKIFNSERPLSYTASTSALTLDLKAANIKDDGLDINIAASKLHISEEGKGAILTLSLGDVELIDASTSSLLSLSKPSLELKVDKLDSNAIEDNKGDIILNLKELIFKQETFGTTIKEAKISLLSSTKGKVFDTTLNSKAKSVEIDGAVLDEFSVGLELSGLDVTSLNAYAKSGQINYFISSLGANSKFSIKNTGFKANDGELNINASMDLKPSLFASMPTLNDLNYQAKATATKPLSTMLKDTGFSELIANFENEWLTSGILSKKGDGYELDSNNQAFKNLLRIH